MKSNKITILFLFSILISSFNVESRTLSEQLQEIDKLDIAIGASSFLVGFIYKLMRSRKVKSAIEGYSEMYRRFTQNREKTKELELLTYFANTYKKDLVNKCKITVKMRLKVDSKLLESELRKYYELCQRWGQYVIDNIHQSAGLYDVDNAFEYFRILVKKELNWNKVDIKKLKKNLKDSLKSNVDDQEIEHENQEARLKQLVTFLDANYSITKKYDASLEDYPLDFSFIKYFYKNQFSEVFDEMLNNNEIRRHKIYMDDEMTNYYDQFFSITEDQVRGENERIRLRESIDTPDNFMDTDYNSLYRYYLPGWNAPLVDVKRLYPTIDENLDNIEE